MSRVKLLDCTLRDGGYVNDWNFGENAIETSIKYFEESRVDILEIGFFKDEDYDEDRTVYNSVEQITDQISPKKDHLMYSAMIEVVNPLPLEKLEVCSSKTVDLIRVVIWKDRIDEGLEYCKGIVAKGYKLCVQPARVEQYTEDEFVKMIEMFTPLNPYAVYVVDSFGTQTKEQIMEYVYLADKHLRSDIRIGYHGHDNMMQALDAAKAFVEADLKHEIIIDASICGMGRGAGNLNLESVLLYLNQEHGKDYRLPPVCYIRDRYILPIKSCHPWGATLPFYFTAINGCNPNYANYYEHEIKVPYDEIEEVLKTISQKDKIIYTKDKAKKYLRDYRKKKLNMVYVIPTCNRHEAIDNVLFQVAETFWWLNIDIVIYDSSDDDRTAAITKNFQIDGYDNVIYKRYEGEFDGFSLDHKIIEAYREHLDYDYIWICRDGLIPTITSCHNDLVEFSNKEIDIVAVDDLFRNNNQESKKYNLKAKEFFVENAVRIVTLGTLILSSSIAKEYIEKYPIDETNYSLWQMIVPLQHMAKEDVKSVTYVGSIFQYNYAGTPNSFWNKAGKAMDQWAKSWYELVTNLPTVYDEHKKAVLKIDMFDFKPFYLNSILRMRGNGGLSISLVKKHKKYLPHVCDTSISKFYLAAITPRFLAKFLVNNPQNRFVAWITKIYAKMK